MAQHVTVKVTGQAKVKALMARAAGIPELVFAQGRLESLLLRRTKARFAPIGTTAGAQKTPDGQLWKPLAPSTLASGGDNKRKLNRSGQLLQSIAILRTNMRDSAIASPTGGGFRIGINPGSPANAYARIQNNGGVSGRNLSSRIPARRYLGIGAGDVRAVSDLLYRVKRKQGF